jgi:hypothetical protein
MGRGGRVRSAAGLKVDGCGADASKALAGVLLAWGKSSNRAPNGAMSVGAQRSALGIRRQP